MPMLGTEAIGKIRKLRTKRENPAMDLVADYISIAVEYGARTIQIGGCDLGSVFLQRGAYHETVAPLAQIDALEADCERHGIRTDRLRGRDRLGGGLNTRRYDVAVLGSGDGLPLALGHWRYIAKRLRPDGVLIVLGADHGPARRLMCMMEADAGWDLQEVIRGEAAVFRKIGDHSEATVQAELQSVASEPRRLGIFWGTMKFLFGITGGRARTA